LLKGLKMRKPELRSVNGLALTILAMLVFLTACGETPTAATTASSTTVASALTTAANVTTAATPATTAATTTSASTTAPANTTSAATTTVATTTATNTTAAAVGSAASCTKLNLNTLTEAQLMSTIPGFSTRMVREFLEYRPYSSIAQYRKEIAKYVSATQVAEWEKYVFVPIKPNESDTETLKQIPGVDNTIATTLASGRPYSSNQAFLQVLNGKISAEQLTSAACYLGA
jgi:radical SAM superfamily enzyme with C-terminal helix-hairpin-helix motif